MPRTLKGEKWEVKYRREVRSIKDGLTASPNGRGLIKATQLIIKDFDKSTVVWCKDLPWTKKDKDRNLEIIRDAFNRTKDSINLSLKSAISLSAIHYDLRILNQKQVKLQKEIECEMNQESNKSINTPQQWACKYDAFLLNEYEFTQEELDELQADRIRQSRRETS